MSNDTPKTSAAQMKAVKKYKQKVKRLTVDFAPTEADLFEHISAQPNKQGYIKALIRADIAYRTGKITGEAPPLGYKVNDKHELIIDKETAAKVQEAIKKIIDDGE